MGAWVREYLFGTLVAYSIALGGSLRFTAALASEERSTDDDHGVIVELAATGEREMSGRSSHLGPTVGVEIEAIEGWLEVEFGATTYKSHGSTNWELELPFKKPFRLSDTVEMMPGLGPTWSHMTQSGQHPSAWGAEAVVDFFFRRTQHVGWYLEPSYAVALGNGNNKSVSLAAGIFFAVP